MAVGEEVKGSPGVCQSPPQEVVNQRRWDLKAIVVTVGSPKESLGAMKLANWLRRTGWDVAEATRVGVEDRADLYAFSCVFSWKLPALVEMVQEVKSQGEVWIGGPAVTFHPKNAAYVESMTGIKPTHGIDERFEREIGSYPMTYFSRGCPAYTPACGLCPVPKIEGNSFRYYPDSQPAKMLLDNNLSALPEDYQEYIIKRYADEWRGGKVDCNSGFEPHTFNAETLYRWDKFPLMAWRFGYDDTTERDQALAMMELLSDTGYSGDEVRVYTMIGNEPIEACHKRIKEVVARGFFPWPQRVRPLDWLGPNGTLPTRFDWDEDTLTAYQRFYSIPQLWRKFHKEGKDPSEFYYQGRYPIRKEPK